ncbi:MAG: YbaY family lipoprotein [Mesorhizobium sp.]|nr:YbaY family lipoprotein [Mesorhizobium sp.]MBN9241509.1 YbaY family lipoprotein [Mesorhizobium sp.]MBN9275676.1 YbaY family lipoprotein [Mesorhizobium sp.]
MLDRIAELFIFGFTPLVVGMMAAPVASVAAEQVLKGEVTYRERMALPAGALVTVQLADVSLADAPAAVVAEQKITPTGQVPVPFELKFKSSAVLEKHSYALQARITVNNELMFINDERHQVDPATSEPQTIVVKMVRQQAEGGDAAAIMDRTWALTFIDGIGGIEGSKATFRLQKDGRVVGQAPCNRYFATAGTKGMTMTIGKPGATMMACEQKLMAQERAFFDAFGKVAGFKLENGALVLTAQDGRALLRFAATA